MARRKKKDLPELVPEGTETEETTVVVEETEEAPASGSSRAERHKSAEEEREEARLRRIAEEMTAGVGDVKRTPTWYVALMLGFMVIGLVWLMVFYITETMYPIPGLNYWNIAIGVGLMMIGLIMTTRWR